MANIIRVRIALKGTKSDIDAMYAKVATENNDFDFNAIIPCPAEKFGTGEAVLAV